MKRTILFLLLAWIAIYAGNHLLFKSVSKNSEVETAVRLHHEEAREIDSWGPYLPGVRTKDDQEPNVTSTKAPLPSQKADANLRGDERIAENLATSDSSEEQVERSPVKSPPTPDRTPHAVSSVPADLATDRRPDLHSRAPKMVTEQKRKTVAEQKRRVARAARNTAPRFANMPDEPPWFPSPPPQRWRSGMFMFAPPDF
jgi:hypothetical protein